MKFLYQLPLSPEPLNKGLQPPNPRHLCPLSSTHPEKFPGYATVSNCKKKLSAGD